MPGNTAPRVMLHEDFQPFRFTRWPFLTVTKLSSYVDSEFTSLAPQAPSSFPSFAEHTATTKSRRGRREGGSLGTRLLLIKYST